MPPRAAVQAEPSPPKRMTRARAKKVDEEKESKTAATKIKTPAAKAATAAAAKKTAAKNAKPETSEEKTAKTAEVVEAPAVKKPATGKATTARVAAKTASKTKLVAKKEEEQASASQETSGVKTRGRPRKNTVTKDTTPAEPATAAESLSKRTTRAKADTASTRAKAAAQPKKKVTFQDEAAADKENIDSSRPTSKEGPPTTVSVKPTALAKGTSKTQASKAGPAKRGKSADAEDAPAKQTRSEPLSPKKGVQVAAKTAKEGPKAAPLGKNERPTSSHGHLEVFSATQHDGEDPSGTQVPPPDASGTLICGSPARRPPPSPFKEAMKSASKRNDEDTIDLTGDGGPYKELGLSKSPKKFNIGSDLRPILEAPDRTQLGISLSGSPARRPPSPIKNFGQASADMGVKTPSASMKASLIQSPARRPPSSVKAFGSSFKAPVPTSNAGAVDMSATPLHKTPLKFNLPSGRPMKAPASPQASPKPRNTASKDQSSMLRDELDVSASPPSPSEDDLPIRLVEMSPMNAESPSSLQKTPSKASTKTLDTPTVGESATAQSDFDSAIPDQTAVEAFKFHSPAVDFGDDDSEDELMSDNPKYATSPTKTKLAPSTPAPVVAGGKTLPGDAAITMTGLADRFGAWEGASPDQEVLEQRKSTKFVFSPIKATAHVRQSIVGPSDVAVPATTDTFSEAMDIRDDEDELTKGEECFESPLQEGNIFRQSQMSDASQEYGDENAMPIDPILLGTNRHITEDATVTPERIFNREKPRVSAAYTTSKVPLKPAARAFDESDSPLERPKAKRSKSMSGPLCPRVDLELAALRENRSAPVNGSRFVEQLEDETAGLATPRARQESWSVAATPARTPRANLNPKLLSGAIVYVDVHTSEGADASSIFVELLGQMGARCVKQWAWNPDASPNSSMLEGEVEAGADDKRVGITHVVFKDGGRRTMEKVRAAGGVVQCVGVGWVLDCEKENKWLEESLYMIDASTIPRGGHRRRKSMEPKSLLSRNADGTLSAFASPAKLSPPGSFRAATSPTKEFLNLSSPAKERRVTIGAPTPSPAKAKAPAPLTPARPAADEYDDFDDGEPTPYFLHPGRLVQQTCPPKQSQSLLFPVSGRIDDQADESVRAKLANARRRSLAWRPRVGSPLSRDFGL